MTNPDVPVSQAALEFAEQWRTALRGMDIDEPASFENELVNSLAREFDKFASLTRPAEPAAAGDVEMQWRPIVELIDIYKHPLWIASPKLIQGDANPLGIAEAYWQDETGPDEGHWRTTCFDMCNDEWDTIELKKADVTHFLIPTGPWNEEELAALETSSANVPAQGSGGL